MSRVEVRSPLEFGVQEWNVSQILVDMLVAIRRSLTPELVEPHEKQEPRRRWRITESEDQGLQFGPVVSEGSTICLYAGVTLVHVVIFAEQVLVCLDRIHS
jgi:hypothetical protein